GAGASGIHGRVRVAAALPGRDGGPDPEGTPSAAVVDAASAVQAADLSRGAPDVRAGRAGGRKLSHLACAAPYGGLPDGGGSAASADRRPACPGPCPADHDADLPDAPQGGSDPPATGPPCRAGPAGGTAGAPPPPPRVPAPRASAAVSAGAARAP